MAFDSFSAFLAMGTHGLYVWLAYGLAMVLMIINVVMPLLTRRRALLAISAQIKLANKPSVKAE